MNANEFERMVNLVIAYVGHHNITKSIRELGFNTHCKTWIREDEALGGVTAVLSIGLDGIPGSYITVFDRFVKFEEPCIGKFELMGLYTNALKNLHRFAVNKKYGLNSCLLNKENSRGGTTYLRAVEPEKIHFNGPATIVEWNDGTKTVVKCQRGDTFDPLTGVAMCCMKKMLGTNESGSNYLNDVSKLIDEAWEAKNKRRDKANKKLRNCEKELTWTELAEKMEQQICQINQRMEDNDGN